MDLAQEIQSKTIIALESRMTRGKRCQLYHYFGLYDLEISHDLSNKSDFSKHLPPKEVVERYTSFAVVLLNTTDSILH